jgi:uncharacterized protein YkwD
VTRLLTALVAAAAAVLIAILVPAGAGAHPARQASYRHHHGARHTNTSRRHSKRRRHRRHARRHAHSRGHHHAPGKHHTRPVKHKTGAGHAQGADTGGTGCAGADLTPGPDNLEAVREATLCLINRERVTRGERALTSNGNLQHAAQGHSESMATNDYFEHEGPGGSTPVSRMRACGYIYSSNVGYEVGENIAWGTLWMATPKAIVEGWMSSPGHRENILDPAYRDTGMGVSPHAPAAQAQGQAGAIYTQDFGVIITG